MIVSTVKNPIAKADNIVFPSFRTLVKFWMGTNNRAMFLSVSKGRI